MYASHKGVLIEWSYLKTMQCPKCRGRLQSISMGYQCEVAGCDFQIGYEKFQEIIRALNQPTTEEIIEGRQRHMEELLAAKAKEK